MLVAQNVDACNYGLARRDAQGADAIAGVRASGCGRIADVKGVIDALPRPIRKTLLGVNDDERGIGLLRRHRSEGGRAGLAC